MRRRTRVCALGIAAAFVVFTPVAALATTPAGTPAASGSAAAASGSTPAASGSAAVSLSGWNLVVPVDASGGSSGDAVTLAPAQLSSPWLTQSSSGALDFWAPSDGARLGISLHARTELRSTGTFTLGQGDAGLTETTSVTQVPDSSHDIIIGQMFPSGTTPFAMMHYQSGKVYAYVHDQPNEYVLMSGIPLGATFTDSITAVGDTVSFSVTYQGKTVTQAATGISSWIGDTMHFQAGDYQQDVSGSAASDGGRVSFSALSASFGTTGGTGFPSGYHQLVVQNSKDCVDVSGGAVTDNAVIDQWTCKTSNTQNQEFQFVPVAGSGYGELQNQGSGKDIVVAGASTAAGAPVVQYTQNGSANGLWQPVEQSDGTTWQFKNQNSGLCLDQTGDVSTLGVQFEQSACGSGANQLFAVH
jgi:hypothetical protein